MIIAAVGSEKERQVLAHSSGHLKRKAKELIHQAGDYKADRNILAMASGELRWLAGDHYLAKALGIVNDAGTDNNAKASARLWKMNMSSCPPASS